MKNSELTYKEIYGQPVSFQAVNDTLDTIFKTLDEVFAEKYDEVIFTGCGTSLYLAQASAHAFSTCTGISAKGMCCSELYYFPETYVGNGKKVLVVPMTRKSYTTEVRMAIDKVRSYPGVKSLAITCDPDSSKYNDYMLLSPETPEDSVIMTRSFTSMIYLAVVMSYYVGGKKEKIEQLKDYAANAESFLKATDEMAKKIVAEHPECNLFITLGQGINYGIANECMNKMKEMSLSNSEAYYTLEYRHGPMSLVDDKTLIILLGNEDTVDGDAKLLTQMKEYGAKVLAIGNNASKDFTDVDYTLDMPYGYDSLQNAPIIGYIGQLIGYYVAELKNLNADSPRHLTQAIVIK
ncbi:SIS domain-containing protein [Lachnospiraceae bacterium HCP1S3_A8]|nr:SIS domain-containing protein [Lachnospiraceae bacterium]